MNSAKAPTSWAGMVDRSNPAIFASSIAICSGVMPATRRRNRGVVVEFLAVKVGTTMVDRGPSTSANAPARVEGPSARGPSRRSEL